MKDILGVKRGSVKLVPYKSEWVKLFEVEKQAIQGSLGNKALEVEHVGSTSIPGLAAKPILDIDVAVESIKQPEDFIKPLSSVGYEFMPERSYPNEKYEYRLFFIKGPEENRTHHLKLIEIDNPVWEETLLFRDYLREHEDARNEYAELKERLAKEFADNREEYTERKADFIQRILKKAV